MHRDEPSEARADIRALPKLSLYRAPLLAAPPRYMQAAMRAKKIDLSGLFDAQGAYRRFGFDALPKLRAALAELVRTPMEWMQLFEVLIEEAARAGEVYVEFALEPARAGLDSAAFLEVVAAFAERAKRAEADLGLWVRLNATIACEDGPEIAKRAALAAQEAAGPWLGGLVVTGRHGAMGVAELRWPVEAAREAGLSVMVEAGQALSETSLSKITEVLRPDRLLCPLALGKDPALTEALAEAGVAAVFNPSLDLAQGWVASARAHPFEALRARGLLVSLAQIGAPFWGEDTLAEHLWLHRLYDWDAGEFRRFAKAALDAAFCGEDTKAVIAKKLEP